MTTEDQEKNRAAMYQSIGWMICDRLTHGEGDQLEAIWNRQCVIDMLYGHDHPDKYFTQMNIDNLRRGCICP